MNPSNLQPGELQTFKDKIKGIRTAMLSTLEADGGLHSRPMATQELDGEGNLWFFTHDNTSKISEVQRDNRVYITYADEGAETYVSASGTGEVVKDKQKIEELWTDFLKAWFPEGKQDPHLALLKVKIQQAEYWDTPGGKMVSFFHMLKAVVTGEPDRSSRNEKLGE